MPDPRGIEDPDDLKELGMLPGEPMSSSYNARWDPPEDGDAPMPVDYDWIGEDKDGIWIRIHPKTALSTEPLLWDAYHSFMLGDHEVTQHDIECLSNFELEAKIILANARGRENHRRLKE